MHTFRVSGDNELCNDNNNSIIIILLQNVFCARDHINIYAILAREGNYNCVNIMAVSSGRSGKKHYSKKKIILLSKITQLTFTIHPGQIRP